MSIKLHSTGTIGLLAGGTTQPRTTRSASNRRRERLAMYGSIHDVHATARRRDLIAEAEHTRRLATIHRPAPAAAIRRKIGAALIQTGRRVQGAPRPARGATGASAALLRTAR